MVLLNGGRQARLRGLLEDSSDGLVLADRGLDAEGGHHASDGLLHHVAVIGPRGGEVEVVAIRVEHVHGPCQHGTCRGLHVHHATESG